MNHISLDDFVHEDEQMDSLYRLVNIAARRANQLNKPESRPLVKTKERKSTIIALEEVLNGKVWYTTGDNEDDDYDIT